MNLGLWQSIYLDCLKSGGRQGEVLANLNERMNTAEDALVYWTLQQVATPANARFSSTNMGLGKTLAADQVDQLFRHEQTVFWLYRLYEVAPSLWIQIGNTIQKPNTTIDITGDMKARVEEWFDQYDYHFIYPTPSESFWIDRFCRLDTEKFVRFRYRQTRNTPIVSLRYLVRTQRHFIVGFWKVYPEAGASGGFIHYCEYPTLQTKIQPLKRFGIMPMTGRLSRTNTPINKALQVWFWRRFTPTERGFACPNCGNSDPKTVDVVKPTQGYLKPTSSSHGQWPS